MSANSRPDRESFQRFLASAYVVQESRIEPRFLSAILDAQRLVTRKELGVEGAMNLVVDAARDVAGATGVAIGLLDGDQITYRAGSGSCALHVGRGFAASLTASERTRAIREILRVENAHTDARVEGAICRQFGAESLLILPIYRDLHLAGVLMVSFSQAHIFQESEIRTYRLMAGLIETAMGLGGRAERKPAAKLQLVPQAQVRLAPAKAAPLPWTDYLGRGRSVLSNLSHRTAEHYGALLAAAKTSVKRSVPKSRVWRQPGLLMEVLVERTAEKLSSDPFRGLALTALAIGFGLTVWITHGSQGSTPPSAPPSPATVSSPQREGLIATGADAADRPAAIRQKKPKVVSSVRRARARQSEVEYIGDDVTVRHFGATSPRQQPQRATGKVAYIGDDVTVRYFTPKPARSSESQ